MGLDTDLDELLARSAPTTTPRDARLQHELEILATRAEGVSRRRRSGLRAALVGAVAAGVLGVGAAGAMAAGVVPTPGWVPWATDSGSSCSMQFTVTAAGPDGEPPRASFTVAEQQRAVDEARRFLATFDYSSVDQARAIRAWRQAEDAAMADEPAGERQPRLTGDDLALTAVGREVGRALGADLARHGVDPGLVVLGQGWRCP
ncbi:MAG: hypothetical protein ACXVD0_01680 [Nocardioides sp.]